MHSKKKVMILCHLHYIQIDIESSPSPNMSSIDIDLNIQEASFNLSSRLIDPEKKQRENTVWGMVQTNDGAKWQTYQCYY